MDRKSNVFEAGIKTFLESLSEPNYMSSVDNWLLVHATSYAPLKNEKGELYIPTTAMATNFGVPRGTVHFTLNHVVESHDGGSWDGKDIVVLLPFQETRRKNGLAPESVSLYDTFFFPQIDKGIILPENAHIVQASSNVPQGKLFVINGNETKYKTDNFSQEEIEFLVNNMDRAVKSNYEKYLNADLKDFEIESILDGLGENGRKLYDKAKDKKAFLKGVLEEELYALFANACREMAVKETAKVMGYRFLSNAKDFGTAGVVAETAGKNNMPGYSSNQGHSETVYNEIEEVWAEHERIIYGGGLNYKGFKEILEKSESFDELYNNIDNATGRFNVFSPYVDAIVKNKPLNLKQKCLSLFKNGELEKNSKLVGLVNRWCDKAAQEFEDLHKSLKRMPGYKDFVEKLKKMPNFKQRMMQKEVERRKNEYYF